MGSTNSRAQALDDASWAAAIAIAKVSRSLKQATLPYALTVENGGLPGRGLSVEDPVVRLIIPAGTEVLAATGPGYQGVKMDEFVTCVNETAGEELFVAVPKE